MLMAKVYIYALTPNFFLNLGARVQNKKVYSDVKDILQDYLGKGI